ncbi:MAG: HPF/RaiA family ribosome-associated protein [Ignavibacteriaceae bacterium]
MNIQINTDHNIQSNEALIARFSGTIKSALSRISDHITSVQVHLSDEDGNKKGNNDKRCMIEARLEGRQPIVVTDSAATLNRAVDSTINKLISMVESIHGRQHDQRKRKTKQSEPEMKFPDEE